MKEIFKALVNAQKEVKNAKLDSKNPHFRSDYASLESHLNSIRSALGNNSLGLYHSVNSDVLCTRLVHSSGEYIEALCPIINSKGDMQGLGSAITYARRYSIAALFNMGSDDDDANHAVIKQVAVKPPEQVPRETKKDSPRNEAPASMVQIKELLDTAFQLNIKPTLIQEQLKERYGIEKSSEIKVYQYNELMKELKGI